MTKKFSREIVTQVLNATDIVEFIGGFFELKPAGSGRFKACCPFHNERTPSFTVSRERQQYFCFGCQKHGDAISFLVEYEGLSFLEALRKLADRASIRLPALSEQDGKEDYLRAQLAEFGKFAARVFREAIEDPLKGSAARQYLKTRQLKPETVKRFGLGYAPDGWDHLLGRAREAGFKETVLEASGLLKRGERGSLYDFFRNRLMVPIRDVSDNVVAFGGRDLGNGTPKYINSPENALYKKGRVLYGLREAREAMRREKRVVLVEGYFDLMRCFDAGIENVVAPCGTALTPDQATLIHRYVAEATVVFDADAAGIQAALRSVSVLTNAGLTVRAMTLPDGKDPDDFVGKHGAKAFEELVAASSDFVTFYVRMSAGRMQTIEGRTSVAREIFGILAGLQDELRREEYLKRTARELQLNEWTCRSEFAKFLQEQSGRAPRAETQVVRVGPVNQHDRDFIAALLAEPSLLQFAVERLAQVTLKAGPLDEVLRALFDDAEHDVAQRLASEEAQRLYAAAANNAEMPAETRTEIVHCRVAGLRGEALLAEEERIQREIDEAQRSGDAVRQLELLLRRAELKRKREMLGAA